jgi:acyl-CoA thioester hydrolase
MTFHFEIYREQEDTALVTAELVYVNADPKTMKAAPLPEDLRSRIVGFEKLKPQANV